MAITKQSIYEKIDKGIRLNEKELQFAEKHKVILWDSVNYKEHQASLPDYSNMPCITDNFDVKAYQNKIRRFNLTGKLD